MQILSDKRYREIMQRVEQAEARERIAQSDALFHQDEATRLRTLLEELKVDCQNQLAEYHAFRKEYDEYRAQFDPVNPATPPEFRSEGNVIHITRFEKK